MELDKIFLENTLDISKKVQATMRGHECPQFRRISHNFHHITLYVKDYIMKEQCKNYLEIGTHYGHSLGNILHSKYPSRFMAIDIFTPWADGTITDMKQCAENNVKLFNTNNYDVCVYKGSSHSQETLNAVTTYFSDGIDLLFIDGDHSHDAVIKDFEMYFPLVNKNGYIIFDDYLPEVSTGVNYILEKNRDKIYDIGLLDDILNVWKLKSHAPLTDVNGLAKNIDYIIQKK